MKKPMGELVQHPISLSDYAIYHGGSSFAFVVRDDVPV